MFKEVLTPKTVMMIPVGRPGANYRDTLPEPGRGGPPDTAFSPMYLPTAIGSPHIIVPSKKTYAPSSGMQGEDQKMLILCSSTVGQNPFESRVSGNVEYAPIVGSLVGAKGQ